VLFSSKRYQVLNGEENYDPSTIFPGVVKVLSRERENKRSSTADQKGQFNSGNLQQK